MNEPSTYFHQAQIGQSLEEGGGRVAPKVEVIGARRIPQYPATSGPWSTPMPSEEPLGEAIDALSALGGASPNVTEKEKEDPNAMSDHK